MQDRSLRRRVFAAPATFLRQFASAEPNGCHGGQADVGASELAATYPGIKHAYEFVVPSYQWMVARFESTAGRLQALQTAAVAIALGVPTVGKAIRPDISFSAAPFISAALLAALVLLLAGVGRTYGAIALANPMVLYTKYLHLEEWEFKKNALYWAGEHFQSNLVLVNRKARLERWATGVLALEALMLLLWLSGVL